MGKSSARKAEGIQTQVGESSLGLSKDLLKEASPQRSTVGDFYNSIVKGDPVNLARTQAPKLNMSRDAYSQAKEQIERVLPKGGVRDQATADLAMRQAGAITNIMSGGVDDAVKMLMEMAQFGTGTSLSSMGVAGNAGDSLARMSAAKAQAVGQGIAGIAGGAGMAFGMKAAGPIKTNSGAGTVTNTGVAPKAPGVFPPNVGAPAVTAGNP